MNRIGVTQLEDALTLTLSLKGEGTMQVDSALFAVCEHILSA